jgi:predicted lipase
MMKKPDTILDEIHATRRRIDERTKDMTVAERTAYFNKRGEASAKKYGFKLIANATESTPTVGPSLLD